MSTELMPGTLIVSRVFVIFSVAVFGFIARRFRLIKEEAQSGFLGFPVVLFVLGREGLAYAALYDLGITLTLWSVVI